MAFTAGFLLLLSAYVASAQPTVPTVVSTVPECSDVGLKLLANGGSAVDAAVSTFLCTNVVSVQGLAVGGGFTLKLWDSNAKVGSILNAMEKPPAKEKSTESKAIEVPGDVAGFWEVHQKYGKLPWATLFDDIIALAANKVQDPKLAETLKKVQENGKDIFYSGEIAVKLIQEIQAVGGVTTLDDFKNYQPEWTNNVEVPTKESPSDAPTNPHAFVAGSDGFCVTVTSTLDHIPKTAFRSESTGVILKEL